jgi:hypothetical protein
MKPRLVGLRSKRTPVTSRSSTSTGSGDASSITITSNAPRVCACKLFRHVNVISELPYTGTTIDTRGAVASSKASGWMDVSAT